MAFKSQTIELSQQSRTDYLIQIDYFLSGMSYESNKKRRGATRKGALKQHNNYIKNFKMFLMALGASMTHFHCS